MHQYLLCNGTVMNFIQLAMPKWWLIHSVGNTDSILLQQNMTPQPLMWSIPTTILMVLAIYWLFNLIFIEKYQFKLWQH